MPARSSSRKVVTVNIRKKTSREYHHGDLRAALLDRAEALLEKGGIESLSLRDAARDLGVSHAAPYRHFPGKIDLLYALAERGFTALGDAMEEAGRGKTAQEQFEAAGILYVELAMAHPVRTELMFSRTIQCSDAPESLRAAGERAFGGLVRIIEYGQACGEFTQGLGAQPLALSAWGLVHGLAVLASGGQIPLADSSALRPLLAPLLAGMLRPGKNHGRN